MGDHEGYTRSSGFVPNGLLPTQAAAASVTRLLDVGRWSKAEGRAVELLACIQPNKRSDELRGAITDYITRLIMRCFPCQVFTFGSVPFKTYLPGGNINLTVFSKNQNLKDTWATEVRNMLENEQRSETAEFQVKEVQYIHAKVNTIQYLVEDIVVDISFNQLGGLCELCFLQEVDQLINQNHLFKCSIILIKAWCYYEICILGFHDGLKSLGDHYWLISTYTLEILVLYVFNVFNKSFAGPLEVLYRFLEFYSNFDWDNFCVSLWGPVPITSLPDMIAEHPRKDYGETLLTKEFLDACASVYGVYPGGQENQGQPFISKHFNVIDPLRTNNNLGRSVSEGNFFIIRSAFTSEAERLGRLFECPEEDLISEVDHFFKNTWTRHGSGVRPVAPSATVGLPTLDPEIEERSMGPTPVVSPHFRSHPIPEYEPAQTSGSGSVIPVVGSGARHGGMNNSEVVPFTFDPTEPPVPSLTMLPVYNLSGEDGNSEGSTIIFDNSGMNPSDQSSEEHESDILHSNFISHWQNLHVGRFIYPSPVMVPPVYLQGQDDPEDPT